MSGYPDVHRSPRNAQAVLPPTGISRSGNSERATNMRNLRFWVRPPVTCLDCGFLAERSGGNDGSGTYLDNKFSECHPDTRRNLQTGKNYVAYSEDGDQWSVVACFHRVWLLWGYSHEATKATAILNEPRRCPYFLRYNSGHEPSAHNELKRDETNRRAMYIVAAINFAAVVVVAFLSIILRR